MTNEKSNQQDPEIGIAANQKAPDGAPPRENIESPCAPYINGRAFPRKQTAGDNWRTPPPAIPESEIRNTYTADIVIIGSGQAGTCAARAAAEAGASVIVLERQPQEIQRFEGGGIVGQINSRLALDQGVQEVDIAEFINDWQLRSNNRSNPGLIANFAKHSGETLDWLIAPLSDDVKASIQIEYHPADPEYDGLASGIRTWIGPAVIGRHLKDALRKSQEIAMAHCARFFFGVSGEQLIQDGRAVVGAIGLDEHGNYDRFLARKGVLLAAGDFRGNPAMCRELLTEITDSIDMEIPDNPGGCDGSGIRMGVWAGGRLEPRPLSSMGGNYYFPSSLPFAPIGTAPVLWLNKYGKRYCNEGFGDIVLAALPGRRQPQGMLAAVFDRNIFSATKYFPATHMALNFFDERIRNRVDQMLSDTVAAGADGYRIGQIILYAADTIEVLADRLGYTGAAKEQFVASIARYNELCRAGKDIDFGKDARLMVPIDTPPYFGYTGTNGLGPVIVTTGGLLTDENQNVLDSNYEPIPGLFATGNCCGGRFGLQYSTPVSGISLGMAQTLGREAGRWMAELPSHLPL